MNALEQHPNNNNFRSGLMRSAVTLAIDDPQTRMYLLTRLVAKIESGDALRDLVRAGMEKSVIDQLRSMSMADALRFTYSPCGLALSIETGEVEGQLRRVELAKLKRERLEYFIRNGASPRLLMHLFAVSPTEARRLRKQIAPTIATGGRSREPGIEERHAIEEAWSKLSDSMDEAERIWKLHQHFPQMWISSLEIVIMPQSLKLTPLSERD